MWRELDIDVAVRLSDHQVVPRQPAAFSSARSEAIRLSMTSDTPAPRSAAVMKSTRVLMLSRAFATATEHSHARKAWSFSASPTPTMLCGDSLSRSERAAQSGGFVHAGREHHDGALVEDHLQLEPHVANDLQHDRVVRLPCGDDHLSNGKRRDPTPSQLLHECLGRSIAQQFCLARSRREYKGAVFGDDTVERFTREHRHQVVQLAASHQEKLSTRCAQPLERLARRVVHPSV